MKKPLSKGLGSFDKLDGLTVSFEDIKKIFGIFKEYEDEIRSAELNFVEGKEGEPYTNKEINDHLINCETNASLLTNKGIMLIIRDEMRLGAIKEYLGSIEYLAVASSLSDENFLNYAEIRFIFKRPSVVDFTRDGWMSNLGSISIKGTSEDWVNSLTKRIKDFLSPKKEIRRYLYKRSTFNIAYWSMILPSIISILMWVDYRMNEVFPGLSIPLQLGVVIYFLFLFTSLYRLLFNWLCYLWPPNELMENAPKNITLQKSLCIMFLSSYIFPLIMRIIGLT